MARRGSRLRIAAFFVLALSLGSCGPDTREDLRPVGDSPSSSLAPRPLPGLPTELGEDPVARLEPAPVTADERLGPPYPIVLAHGWFGFEELAGIDAATYFFGVKDDLAEAGETLVFTPAVDPFNDSTTRAEQLLEQIERILAETGHRKVNIIGHSQGGLDARAVANMRPDLVASVVTFATPHRGSAIADIALNLVPNQDASAVVDWLVRQIGRPLYDALGEETSMSRSFQQLSTPGMEAFNRQYPDRPSVAYFSLAGRSDMKRAEQECEADVALDLVRRFDLHADPIDPALAITETALGAVNDGLVTVESARWGRFLGCVPADHLDQIGHLFGDGPGLGNPWRHKPFYRDLVAWLRYRGF